MEIASSEPIAGDRDRAGQAKSSEPIVSKIRTKGGELEASKSRRAEGTEPQ